ncbi:MAG: hypothetical protein WCJ55_11575 [Chloroflexales bacterium]
MGYRRPAGVSLRIACSLFPLILWLIAYQSPARITLRMGGDVAHQRRFDENPFLRQINGSEPPDSAACPADAARRCWWWQLLGPDERPYRWTSGNTTATFPGLGGGPFAVAILARGQPGPAATPSAWQVGAGSPLMADLPPGQLRRYHILAAADPWGDLRITMHTTPFAAPGDPRELGFVLYELRVAQTGAGPRAPAWPQLAWLAVAVATAYGVARALSVGPRLSYALALALALVLALALALIRPEIAIFTPTLASIGIAAALIAAAGWIATRRLGAAAPFARQVLALTLLALALRVGGMLHPHAMYSDSGFHANKLYSLSLGQVFQTAGLPSEAGGGQAPYPTGAYILLLPGQLLLPSGARVALVQIGTAALDSLLLPLIALLTVRAGLGRRAALLGAACYILPIPALESLSIGELANIGGQSIAMGFVALLTLGALSELAPGRRPLATAALTAALTAGLLAHSGVTLSLGAFTAAAWLIILAPRALPLPSRPQFPAPSIVRLALVAALALGAALLIYYSAPIYLERILGRVGAPGGADAARKGLAPLTILHQTATGIFGLTPTGIWSLPPLLGALALAGLGLLWVRRGAQPRAAGIRLTLAAFWLGTLISQALLLVADQGVRWTLFLYPALCLSAGPLLGNLQRRGRAGRAVALAALGATLAYGLLVWLIQIRDYYHL